RPREGASREWRARRFRGDDRLRVDQSPTGLRGELLHRFDEVALEFGQRAEASGELGFCPPTQEAPFGHALPDPCEADSARPRADPAPVGPRLASASWNTGPTAPRFGGRWTG